MRKRIIALLLALILTVGLLPTVALAAEPTAPTDETPGEDAVSFTKDVVTKGGQDKIKIEAYVNGDVETSVTTTPCDIVLVLDQSGSMGDTVNKTEYTYTEVNCTEWSYNKVREYSKNTTLYYQPCWRCGDAHRVSYWENFKLFRDDTYQIGYQCGGYWYALRDNGRDSESTSRGYVFYTGKLYTRTAKTTSTNKYQALKAAASAFLNTVSANAKQNKVDHRVAIVGFGSAGDDYYRNTEILTLKQSGDIGKNYSRLQADDYKNALVSCNTASGGINSALTDAVNALDANGATAVDLGLKMANNIFKNQTTGTYTGENARAKIVVVVTDGNPTHSDGFENDVATGAIKQAKTMKDSNTKVFTIGIALDGNKAKNFISYVSSDYPDATAWNYPGQPIDAAPKYTSYVSDAEAMKEIFSDIASEATSVSASAKLTQTAVLTDTISQYFKLPEGATKDSIEVYTSAAKFEDGAFTWDTEEKLTNANVKIDGQKIEVTGFDYTANCVTKTAKNKAGTDFGKKLVIYIPIEKDASKGQFGGYLPTNDDATLNDPNGDKGYKADGAHKDCTVVAPKLAGKTIEINAGESATTTELFKNITPNGTEWPDGNNNAGVDLKYTIMDEQRNTIATAEVPAGTSTVTWTFADGKTDANQYAEAGEYKFTIDCEATCKNKTAHEGSTASSERATGTIKVRRTTATVTLTKTITGLSTDDKSTVRNNLKIYAKDSENAEHELEKDATSGTYSAELAAGNYTIVEKDYDVTGYDCATTLTGSQDLTFTVVADTDQSLTLTNAYSIKKYSITYQYENTPDGAPKVPGPFTNVEYNSAQTVENEPTLAGWTFSGWRTDDVTVTGGRFTMPNKDVVFKGSWTEKDKVTITYVVVGPTGCGTVTPASETPYVDADANAVSGSEATATDSYRFVGWYAEEDCTTLLTAESHYTPRKTGDNWTGATYYAKFEAIPTPGADDLPKVNVICTNTVMGHDASNTELTESTYTVGRTQYENGVYTCKVTLNQTQGHIDTYNASNPGHTDDETNANVEKITLTYDAARQTWTKSADTFKIYVVCNTTEFNVTYNWTGLDDATFESGVEPKQPSTAKVTKGGKHTVDTDYKAGDIRAATNGDKYRFSGWSSATEGVVINENGEITNIQNNITLTGTWTKLGSGTFDLNDKIFKVFDEADGSRDIPRSSYTFEVKVTRLDKETNELTDEKYTGTVTLDGATATATPSFVFHNPITFHIGGEYRFLVEEKSNTVTALSSDERIDYDNAEYYLYVTVSDDLKTINYRFEHVLVITSAEEESAAAENQPITFYNYYYAAKEPGKYTIDFSDLIVKCLTKEGSKAFTGAEFTANVTGWKYMKEEAKPWAMLANATSFAFTDLPSRTLTATFLADAVFNPDNEAYRPFTGDTLTVEEGDYLFLIEENNGGQSNITYDEAKYWLAVRVRFEDDEPIVAVYRRTYTAGDSYNTVFENETKWSDPIPANITPVTFYNTIDTGKDDYYPIIIPTIINKDTGMLNKTDHFAYVIGYPDGTVHPNGQITRAEVATIFFRLLRDEVRDGAFTTSNTYSDVAYGKWYNNPISTMSALGIITGYPDGTFKPNKPITRAEFAAIAARFDETQSGKSATFSDVIGHWAAKEIGIAYYNDWIKGYPDGTFKPDQNITRAEAMTLINRVLERKPESPADLLTNMNKWTDNMDTSKWYYLDVQEATNSHGYTRKTFNYELWRQMLNDPDWSRYER